MSRRDGAGWLGERLHRAYGFARHAAAPADVRSAHVFPPGVRTPTRSARHVQRTLAEQAPLAPPAGVGRGRPRPARYTRGVEDRGGAAQRSIVFALRQQRRRDGGSSQNANARVVKRRVSRGGLASPNVALDPPNKQNGTGESEHRGPDGPPRLAEERLRKRKGPRSFTLWKPDGVRQTRDAPNGADPHDPSRRPLLTTHPL